MKKLTKKQKADIFQKKDFEGLEGYLRIYAEDDFKGTEHEKLIKDAVDIIEKVSNLIASFDGI